MNPILKFTSVLLTCAAICYVNFLLFNSFIFEFKILEGGAILFFAIVYVAAVSFFGHHFFKRKKFLLLIIWILFNLAICLNFSLYATGIYPPLPVQYSQSTLLSIYVVLLIITKSPKPNWLRIFGLTSVIVLIPCLTFYFFKMWSYYEPMVYLLCFTPVIKGLVFFEKSSIEDDEILDVE